MKKNGRKDITLKKQRNVNNSGMSEKNKKWFSLNLNNNSNKTSTSCGCGKTSGGCKTHNQEEIDENVFFNDAVDASVGEQRPKD